MWEGLLLHTIHHTNIREVNPASYLMIQCTVSPVGDNVLNGKGGSVCTARNYKIG